MMGDGDFVSATTLVMNILIPTIAPLLCLIGVSLVKLPQAARRHDDYSTETEPAEEPSQSKNTAFKRRFRYLRRSKRFHRWYLLPLHS